MNIKVKTQELKDAVNKVVKGMGNNKNLPITEMIGINVKDTTLSLVTTDNRNKVQVDIKLDEGSEETSFAVNGTTFSKLISKITTEYITLSNDENKLIVKANGTYTFPFTLDEEKNLLEITNIEPPSNAVKSDLDVKLLKAVYSVNKASVAETFEHLPYTGFYFDATGCATTNSLKLSFISDKLFDNAVLLSITFIQLCSILTEDTGEAYQTNSAVYLKAGNVTIQGKKMEEISQFPIEDMKPFLENDLPHKVRVNKDALLKLLDRISVLVSTFDKNTIKIDFEKDGMRVWTVDGKNNELIPYTEAIDFEPSSIKIDVTNLKNLITANPEAEVIIMYGSPNALKMTFGTVSQVLALAS